MNINFEIYGVNEADHTVQVRYWTDILSLDTLGCVRNEDGSVKESRTDLNIGCPADLVLDATDPAFREFILQFAPSQWFGILEAKAAGKVGPLTLLLGGVASFEQQVIREAQARLDTFFAQRGYDGILSAATYATSTVPKFAAEGQYAVNARDKTWSTLYTILGDVMAGNRAVPTLEDILAELPELTWPE